VFHACVFIKKRAGSKGLFLRDSGRLQEKAEIGLNPKCLNHMKIRKSDA
jgi:hypothetical protein